MSRPLGNASTSRIRRARRRSARRLAGCALGVLLALSGCAPGFGGGGVGAPGGGGADRASAEVARQLEEMVGFVDGRRLVGFVQSVGARVAAEAARSDIDYRFHVLDMPVPNAFALPSGEVYVTRGLLQLVNSEDELAGVLAHEVAHVDRDHASGRTGVEIVTAPIRIGTGIAGFATGIFAPRAGAAIAGFGRTASDVFLAPYSREQEREADRVGQALAARAGYAPIGLANLLDTMTRVDALAPGRAETQDFFSTHPATEERLGLTREHAVSLDTAPRRSVTESRAEALELLAGMSVGNDPAHGLFDDNWFIHPDLRIVMAFPPGWETVNTLSFAAARSPQESAFVALVLVKEGEDPMFGARAISERLDTDLASTARRVRINGLPAAFNRVQLSGEDGAPVLSLTWIAHRGVVYQVMGLAPQETYEKLAPVFAYSAASFRPMTEEERDLIWEVRLRIIEAEEGETLSDLGARVESVWSEEYLAAVNRRELGERLRAGELVKVAVAQPYEGGGE